MDNKDREKDRKRQILLQSADRLRDIKRQILPDIGIENDRYSQPLWISAEIEKDRVLGIDITRRRDRKLQIFPVFFNLLTSSRVERILAPWHLVPNFVEYEQGAAVTVNGERYRAMLNKFLFPQIEEDDMADIQFQHDEATQPFE